jgi:hypothetical protein
VKNFWTNFLDVHLDILHTHDQVSR